MARVLERTGWIAKYQFRGSFQPAVDSIEVEETPMTVQYKIHDLNTAPEGAKATLDRATGVFGFLPNILGTLANSPTALRGYFDLVGLFLGGTFSSVEQHVVLLTVGRENNCHYCVPAHTVLARGASVPDEIIRAIRDDREIADPKLQALRQLTSKLVRNRGFDCDAEIDRFLAASYQPEQILEIIAAIAAKTLTTYTAHIAKTEVDPEFESGRAW